MTTVYLLKQMIRLWSARSCWNTLEKISAANPPRVSTQGWQPTVLPGPGTKPAPKERCHSREGAGTAPVLTQVHP